MGGKSKKLKKNTKYSSTNTGQNRVQQHNGENKANQREMALQITGVKKKFKVQVQRELRRKEAGNGKVHGVEDDLESG